MWWRSHHLIRLGCLIGSIGYIGTIRLWSWLPVMMLIVSCNRHLDSMILSIQRTRVLKTRFASTWFARPNGIHMVQENRRMIQGLLSIKIITYWQEWPRLRSLISMGIVQQHRLLSCIVMRIVRWWWMRWKKRSQSWDTISSLQWTLNILSFRQFRLDLIMKQATSHLICNRQVTKCLVHKKGSRIRSLSTRRLCK